MKLKGLRWWIIALICLATIINYIDRSAFGIMWPEMGKDLGMDDYDYALMLNIFMVTYAAGKFLSGKLMDIIGTRLGFAFSIILWSLASVFHAFSKGLVSLGIFRGLLGLGEAGNWPGAVKSNGEWFPVNQRALAQGIFNAGASVGSIIAPALIAVLYGNYGWRSTYIIIGALGILWVIPWFIINKAAPKHHSWITDEEKALIMEGRAIVDENATKEKGLSLLQILSYKESWGVLAARFFIEPIWWLFVGWMPLYLNSQFGFSVEEIGSTMWISYVGGMIGSLAGGWYSGKLMAKHSVDFSRKRTILIGATLIFLGLLGIIFLVDDNNPMTFIYITGVVLFGFQFAIGNIQTLSTDLFRGPSVGTLAGLAGTVGAISVIIMNWFIPMIASTSYTPAFIVIAILAPMVVISIFGLIRNIKIVENN
ncbi:MFS transporter [uncultured Dokdonia sp.]|uniref:MFS transporter n=1 Tax=Dokdonia sp. Asnod2-E02 TaxID=3160574 RepID=UPI00260B0243|nr:MFS transporter [uncultured Dokdonia sp.]